MSTPLLSAGLLYVYLSGYEENGQLYVQQIDSYRYIEDELYHRIMETAELADKEDDTIHIFAIVGQEEKTKAVCTILENGVKANFQRIIDNQAIKISTRALDCTGNLFFHCVQEFFCAQPGHFPISLYRKYNDVHVSGIYCSHMPEEETNALADALLSLWLARENPMLCGQQLMTRSFFMRDFIDRKVVAALPDTETGSWRLIVEGGHQLYLDEDVPYAKETLHPNDLGAFCPSNLQSILLNPIYAYAKWFQPTDICEEWHKVFLYLCAVSSIDWDRTSICQAYENYLAFLEENICLTADAPPLIPKELYLSTLLVHISSFRSFLRGDDEPVISKDLLQTLNSRYVYLPHLWPLLNPKLPQSAFFPSVLQQMVEHATCATDANKKGALWEDAAEYYLSHIEGWKITGRRIHAGAQEIDLSVINISLDHDLWQLGAYILVECKIGIRASVFVKSEILPIFPG